MSISLSIFPGLAPGQSFKKPALPIRSPQWNYKETAHWNNDRQQAVNGRVVVTKYWPNALHSWEWVYGYLKDNPLDINPFYTVPPPATDLEMLKAFYADMQGTGNEFAYQPPDSARGGSFNVTSAVVLINGIALLGINPSVSVTRLRRGDSLHLSGLGSATYLNGNNGTVIAIDSVNNKVTLQITTTGTHALVSDSGTAVGGQVLAAADANLVSEFVNTVGSYGTTVSPTPTFKQVVESVKLVDPVGLTCWANGTAVGATLGPADTIAPYPGQTLTFGSAPALPITIGGYSYYYYSRFEEDMQEYDNFMAMLHACSSVKFGQSR